MNKVPINIWIVKEIIKLYKENNFAETNGKKTERIAWLDAKFPKYKAPAQILTICSQFLLSSDKQMSKNYSFDVNIFLYLMILKNE